MRRPLVVTAAWAIRAAYRPWPVSVLSMAVGTGSHRHWPISAGWAAAVVVVVVVEPMPEVSAMRAVRQVFMARAAVAAVPEPALAVRAALGLRASCV